MNSQDNSWAQMLLTGQRVSGPASVRAWLAPTVAFIALLGAMVLVFTMCVAMYVGWRAIVPDAMVAVYCFLGTLGLIVALCTTSALLIALKQYSFIAVARRLRRQGVDRANLGEHLLGMGIRNLALRRRGSKALFVFMTAYLAMEKVIAQAFPGKDEKQVKELTDAALTQAKLHLPDTIKDEGSPSGIMRLFAHKPIADKKVTDKKKVEEDVLSSYT